MIIIFLYNYFNETSDIITQHQNLRVLGHSNYTTKLGLLLTIVSKIVTLILSLYFIVTLSLRPEVTVISSQDTKEKQSYPFSTYAHTFYLKDAYSLPFQDQDKLFTMRASMWETLYTIKNGVSQGKYQETKIKFEKCTRESFSKYN